MTTDVREQLRQTVAQLADLGKRRDELIRQGLTAGISAMHLAADAQLSLARIYQIRDGRR
jgi:hypothetical protein